jgi:hypothetical protein
MAVTVTKRVRRATCRVNQCPAVVSAGTYEADDVKAAINQLQAALTNAKSEEVSYSIEGLDSGNLDNIIYALEFTAIRTDMKQTTKPGCEQLARILRQKAGRE